MSGFLRHLAEDPGLLPKVATETPDHPADTSHFTTVRHMFGRG